MKIIAILLASLASTEATNQVLDGPTEYEFSRSRCGGWRLNHKNQCEDECMGDDDDAVGCSWSWPIGENQSSAEAACRCNQREFYFIDYVAPAHRCGNECEAGETCHKSWPFYMDSPTAADKEFRCKGPLEVATTSEDEDAWYRAEVEAWEAAEAERIRLEEEAAEVERIRLEEEAAAAAEAELEDVAVCEDTNIDDNGDLLADDYDDGCAEYAENTSWCGNYDSDVFFSMEMCCACMALDSDPLDIAAIVENWPAYDADTCEDNLDVKDLYNDTCSDYVDHTDWCFVYDHDNFDSGSDCCVCAALSGQELFDQLEYGANYEEDDYYDEETHGYDEWDDDW